MTSNWSAIWRRTRQSLRETTGKIARMDGAALPNRGPRLLYSFNTREAAAEAVLGCDADIGGRSSVAFALDTSSAGEPAVARPTGKFHGRLRLDVRPGLEGRINSGYAGFRTPVRSTLFGNITDNVYFHDYLALRVRAAGDPVLHRSYFVNVQTVDQMSHVSVWQQALPIRRQDNDWETCYVRAFFLPLSFSRPRSSPSPALSTLASPSWAGETPFRAPTNSASTRSGLRTNM
ncbi:hypothetical protein B0H15DRAFT_845345, partial [Mycena belliarum]